MLARTRNQLRFLDATYLKQAVDEGREGGAFGQDENQTQGQQQDDDRCEPPLFADTQKAPELSQDRKLSTHKRNISAKA
jgi:hypothetical protein